MATSPPAFSLSEPLSEFEALPDAVIVHDPVTSGAFDAMSRVSPELLEEEYLFRQLPDRKLYAIQHREFVTEVSKHVPHVIPLRTLLADYPDTDALLSDPNQVFTRDSLITIPWVPEGYIAARLRPERRRSEPAVMSAAVERIGLREIVRVPQGMFLEGGDCVPFVHQGRRALLLGHGPRSSIESAWFLQESLIPDYFDEIIALRLAHWRMNLDGGFLPVANDVVIADTDSILEATVFDARSHFTCDPWDLTTDLGMKVIETTRHESVFLQACNCLCLGNREVICYDMCERVLAELARHDVRTHTFPGSQLVKGRGGPRCMSRPIYRPPDDRLCG